MANNQQLLLGEGAGGAPAVYIEDVFSTYLYTANNTVITITNGIDLATKGGLVWQKGRNGAGYIHCLFDTARGVGNILHTDNTAASDAQSDNAALSTGFTTGRCGGYVNSDSLTYASWTFRKQKKFFDVVTYTGNGSGLRSIPHSLGSTPGVAILKKTSTTSDWIVTDPGGALGFYGFQPLYLNNTNAKEGFNQTGVYSADATSIYVGSNSFSTGTDFGSNDSGVTYVAYLFAHNAGGFGPTGTDNVISCGSYTGAGSPYTGGSEINLGYEPQWVLIKSADNATNWVMIDNMRGWEAGTSGVQNWLYANTSGAENTGGQLAYITSTGFKPYGSSLTNNTGTYIYIAIRRGPMKVPTVGTSVYQGVVTGAGNFPYVITNTVVDFAIRRANKTTTQSYAASSRLTGDSYLLTTTTDAEAAGSGIFKFDSMSGWYNTSLSATPVVWNFQRAPGFFDVVCDTGTGAAHTITHNLGVPAELFIRKMRSGASNWWCYNSIVGGTKSIKLNDSGTYNTSVVYWNDTDPTSTTFSVGTTAEVNQSGSTFVTYLFATCAGVSKVGSYTGNGSSQTIACGFAAGSRFVMIKRTDSTGDWYVWDSARGIIAGNDPHLSLNTTAAEVTTDDSVDTDNSGFIVNQLAATNVNVTSATYIFLAIA